MNLELYELVDSIFVEAHPAAPIDQDLLNRYLGSIGPHQGDAVRVFIGDFLARVSKEALFNIKIDENGLSKLNEYKKSKPDDELAELGPIMMAAVHYKFDVPVIEGALLYGKYLEGWKDFELSHLSSSQRRAFNDVSGLAHRSEEAARRAEEAEAAILDTKNQADTMLADISRLAEDTRSNVVAKIEESDRSINSLRTQASELVATFENLNTRVADNAADIENFIKAVRESLGLQNVRNHWTVRARSYRDWFYASGLTLLLLIAGAPLAGFCFRDQVIPVIMDIDAKLTPVQTSGAATDNALGAAVGLLNRILFFGLPAALYIWLIKYMIRLNQHNLLLSDDAAQRSTMIDTYYNLVAEGAAGNDREIILTALFRPGVAQATDNVDLPIIEAIKAISGKG